MLATTYLKIVSLRILRILLFTLCWIVASTSAKSEGGVSQKTTVKGPDVIWLEHDGANNGWVREVKGEPSVYLRSKHFRTWSVRSPAWHWAAVDVNYAEDLIYLFDRYGRYHVQLSMDGSLDILNYGSSSEVHGLAYDWLSRNLYWTDSLYNWIQVMKLGTNYVRTLIDDNLDRPHGIAVYPQKGLMFWTDWGENQKIQQANMDGTGIMELVTTNLNKPMGITIDYTNNKLFWTSTHVIESYDLVSGKRQRYVDESQSRFIDVAVYKQFLFAIDLGMALPSKPKVWFFGVNGSEESVKLPIPRTPYGITVYANSRQQQLECPCTVNLCHHLCVPAPSPHGVKGQCLCRDGYSTTDNGQKCQPSLTSKGAMYVYTLQDRICAVPIKRTTKTTNDNPKQFCFFNSKSKGYKFRTVNFNYKAGEIYFTESGMGVQTIRRAQLEHKGVNRVLVYGTGDVKGLVIDWMTSNMYWTDAQANAIWVSRLEGQYMRKLVKDVHNPVAIALDIKTRRLFWTESLGRISMITTANLDGTNRTTFVSNKTSVGNSAFTSLAVDYVAHRLYWVNPVTNKIWSANLVNGSDHQMQPLQSTYGNIYGVTVMQDFVGFTENSASSGIHVVEKESGKEMIEHGMKHTDRSAAYDIVAYYSGNQRDTTSRCGIANGECEQLCFPTRSGRTCGCTDRMKLSSDGVSCEPSLPLLQDKFFLIADNYHRQIFQANENLGHIRALKFPPFDRPIGLTYDFVSDRVFWAEYSSHVVKSMHLNGSDVKQVIGYSKRSRIEGVAFDTESQLLYYTDSRRNIVAVMNPSGRYHKVLIRGINSPRAIVLDPANGYMYVTSRKTNRGRIIRYRMDGKNETVLVASGLSRPNGLAIDFKNQNMYWCDAQSDVVEMAGIDGQNRKVLWKGISTSDQFDIAVHRGFVYWTDTSQKGFFRISLDGTGRTKLGAEIFSGLNDIKYFSRAGGKVTTACTVNNGQCSHFCIPLPGNQRTCECPDETNGSPVTSDGKNCPGIKTCSRNFPDGTVEECSLRIGESCQVKCPENYRPTVPQIKCLKGPVWNADVNRLCILKTCPEDIPSGGFDGNCSRHIGQACRYSCNVGYSKAVDRPLKCQKNQTWDVDVTALCQSKSCPDSIHNGYFDVYCNRHVGQRCRYYCKAGYGMKVYRPLKCQTDLNWDIDVTAVCQKLVCPALEMRTNTQLNSKCPREASVGDSCTLSCMLDTVQSSGSLRRTCLYDLTWSGTPLVCNPIRTSTSGGTGGTGGAGGGGGDGGGQISIKEAVGGVCITAGSVGITVGIAFVGFFLVLM